MSEIASRLLKSDHGKFDYEVVRGEVMETNSWSESHVSGGGGGSISIRGTGFGRTQSVKTQVKNKREAWIKDRDGVEYHFVLDSDRVGMRAEQEVSVVYTIPKVQGKKHDTVAVSVYNHAQRTLSHNAHPAELAMKVNPWPFILGIFSLIFGFVFPGLFLVLAGCVVWFWRLRGKIKKQLNAIDEALLSSAG